MRFSARPARARAGVYQRRESGSVPFGRRTFLVAPVALTLGNDLLGLAAPVRRERLADIDLVFRELPFRVTPRIALIARVRLNDFAR